MSLLVLVRRLLVSLVLGLKPGTRTTGNAMLRAIAVVDEPGNDIDVAAERAFPKLEVRLVKHVDAYISAGPSVN